MSEPLFSKVDAVVVRVPDLESGLRFYRDGLGHHELWRNDRQVGLQMPDSDAELVLALDQGPETDLLVEDVRIAADRLVTLGGRVVVQPFDVPVGRICVAEDPFGNRLVLIDLSGGTYEPKPNA